ncbi:MAG: hypothetical protein GYA55_00290 [SAR324 cluster bacterium]|uniref:Uncharacterized protein n=1 Tax=SAR324 cluster bacterium TaxID=2024889 RepID=A0A7X9FNV2_9DELT|nr:hypothetical protein [SAR324 cluster bacterium]
MKGFTKIVFFITTFFLLTVSLEVSAATRPTNTRLRKVCPRIYSLGYHQLYKYEASGHLASSDRARSCSFIGGPGAPSVPLNYLPIYDKFGNQLSGFKNYARGGYYAYRFYTYGLSCAGIAAKAKKNTGSSTAYVKLRNDACVIIPNLYQRHGRAY